MRVCVIGDGGWGTALALLLHGGGHEVIVWGPFEAGIRDVVSRRENVAFLPGVSLPEAIRWTSAEEEAAAGAELAVLASPTRYYRGVVRRFATALPAGCGLVSVAKGVDAGTYQRMTQVAGEELPGRPVAALSGPSHAEEVARGIPTAVVIASETPGWAERLQRVFAGERFRVYTSGDAAGVEYGGAFKNVIAVAVGVSDGLGFGDNTRAALITRGLAEITRLGVALGAQPRTFAGLSGMGDLIVTCTSRHSRNRSVGEQLGRGRRLDEVLAGMKQVAEGVWNCRAVRALARRHGLDAPIAEELHAILHDGRSPAEAVQALMARDAKPE